MNNAEKILNDHCSTYYNRNTGDEEIEASKSSVIIAMDEYSKENELKSIIHAHRYALSGTSLEKTIGLWKEKV